MTDMSASNVVKITLEREDGSTEVITRGLIADFKEATDQENGTVSFDICGMGGQDLVPIVESVIALGYQLGIIGQDKEENS